MQTKLPTAALALLLFAGASGAAMAQDHDRGDRGQSAPQAHPQPQPHAGPPGGGGGHFGGPPHAEGGPRGPGPGPGEHADHAGPPGGGFHGHEGPRGPEAPAGGAPPHVEHQRGGHEGGPGPGPGPGAPRQFDRDRGGHEVIPPGARFEGGPGGHAPPFGGTHGAPSHWRAGRFPPVISAHDRFRAGSYRPPYGYYSRAWGFGDFLPRPWFVHDYWLDDFLDFDLPYPPPGYIWVRVGPDAVMIDRFTGRVVQVVQGIFW
jgi:Ni/Co efflux regulator RcnB